jgi:hypothetical protein
MSNEVLARRAEMETQSFTHAPSIPYKQKNVLRPAWLNEIIKPSSASYVSSTFKGLEGKAVVSANSSLRSCAPLERDPQLVPLTLVDKF